MKLIVDANILVAELLRRRGRALMRDPRLSLRITEKVLDEAHYELRKRVAVIVSQRQPLEVTGEEWLALSDQLIADNFQVFAESEYANLELEARRRIPRDPDDWHTVALALHTEAAIWTQDYDFLGCGCPTWTTETLLLQLQATER